DVGPQLDRDRDGGREQTAGKDHGQHLPHHEQEDWAHQLPRHSRGAAACFCLGARRRRAARQIVYLWNPFQKVPSSRSVTSPTTSLPPYCAINSKACLAGPIVSAAT